MKPLILNHAEVRAIGENRKTQFRVPVKPQPPHDAQIVFDPEYTPEVVDRNGMLVPGRTASGAHDGEIAEWGTYSPYAIGDRLWVRESYLTQECVCQSAPTAERGGCKYCGGRGQTVVYKADATCSDDKKCCKYKSPVTMPRWASRHTLEVTGIRVERLNEISEADAIAEGAEKTNVGWYHREGPGFSYCVGFQSIWESIHGPGSWDANPWVFAYTFRRVSCSA